MKKILSVVASLAILANSLLYPFSYVYAQEETSTPEPTPIVEEIITPALSPEPTVEPSITPTAIPEPTPTQSPSPWTFEKVELNKEYQNGGVTLTFTKLPDPAGNIKIEEITISEEQIKQTGSLSNKAYDITSDMENGTFEYTLTLPTSTTNNVEVKASEDGQNFVTVGGVTAQIDTLTITSLNHFTIFVVTGTINEAPIPDEGVPFTEGSDTVIINEILYRPNSGNEWIELYNNGNSPVLLTGWRLSDGNTVTTDDIDLSGTIPAHGILVFEHANLWLNDDGDTATLKNDIGTIISQVTFKDAGATAVVGTANVGAVDSGQSIGRTTDGNGNPTAWQVFTTPTKGWFNGAPAPTVASIVTGINGGGVTTNWGTSEIPDSSLATGLYFDKAGAGRVTFSATLNLTDSTTTTFLQNLGTKMEASAGSMKFDARTALQLKDAGAEIKMYGLDALGFTNTPNIIVKNDAGTVISPSDTVNYPSITGITFSGGTLTFNASHFTQFDIEYPVTNEMTGLKYTTIQAAIDAASDGDTITVAAGTYNYVSEGSPAPKGLIKVTKGVTIKAAAGTRPIIDGSGFDGVFKIHPSALLPGNTVIIEGFEIKGNEATSIAITTQGGYDVTPAKVIIRDNWFHGMVGGIDFWGAGGYLPPGWTSGVINTEITGNKFYDMVTSGTSDQGFGVMIEDPINRTTAGDYAVKIENNEFSNLPSNGSNPGVGIVIPRADGKLEAANVYIAGNNFTGGIAVGIAIDGTASIDVTDTRIINNDLSGTTLYGIMVGNIVNGPVNATNNWWGRVSPDFDTIISGTVDHDPWYINAGKTILSSTIPTTVYVDDGYTDGSAGGHYFGYDAFTTIQAGISAVANGGTVNVEAGDYTEQVIINKNLTLQGAGRDSTKILSPASLTKTGTGKSGILAVVSPDSANPITVYISGITVDGQNQLIDKLVGVHFFAANGSLSNSRVTGMRDSTLGTQERWGVFTNHEYDKLISTHVTISGNIIDNYQKAGIVATELGSTMTATGNTVTGAGPTAVIAQNGIESNYGASAIISGNNIVSGHNYTGPGDDYGAGILVVGNHLTGNPAEPSTSISNNTVSDNEIGIAVSKDIWYGYGDGLATINNNSITGNITGLQNDNLSGTLNATENWWGSNDPDFTSITSGNVDHDPWYVNSGMTILSDAVEDDTVTAPSGSDDLSLGSDDAGDANLPDGVTDVVLDDDSGLDLSAGLVDNTVTLQSGSDDADVVLTNSSLPDFSVSIPDGTEITGPVGVVWDGVIMPPTDSPSDGTAPAGFSVGGTVISIGSSQGTLVFDQAVTILLKGVTGTVGYKPALSDTWQEITNICTGIYENPTGAVYPGECAINNGIDTKIVTFHFTSFGNLNSDICANIDGFQSSVPDGMHLDASGKNCVNWGGSGPAPRNDEGASNGQVAGVSTLASNYQYNQTSNSFSGDQQPTANEEVLGENTESEKTPVPEVKGTDTSNWNARNIALISFGSALAILALLLLWRKKKTS